MKTILVSKYTIACVEYHNTLPFIHSFKYLEPPFQLIKVIPSFCSKMFKSGEADISLVPVGSLPNLDNYQVIEKYCIGCNGPVYSVAILSHVPIEEITLLNLDPHSETSNQLARILCREYWQINPEFVQEETTYDKLSQVAIGDKVFALESNYAYKYDLGEIWKAHTGLAFAFAVWIKSPHVADSFVKQMLEAFDKGFGEPDQWITENVNFSKELLQNYLHNHIKYIFDGDMKKSMHMFLSKIA